MITQIKKGEDCILRVGFMSPGTNTIIDLRGYQELDATLIQPNGISKKVVCKFDEVINKVVVRLTYEDIALIGVYGFTITATKYRRVISTPISNIIEVCDVVDSLVKNVNLYFDAIILENPDNVVLTGASPRISEKNTWLVYNDSLKAYEDTGISVSTGEGNGLTIAEKKWLGIDKELVNGSTSLPEGINKNTGDLQALGDGVNDNSRAIVAINEVLAARFPFRIISFSGGKIAEKGTTVSVTLAWSYDGVPTSQKLAQNGSDVPVLITDRSKSIAEITANTTFVLSANGLTASQSISFYNCRYIGVVSVPPSTESDVKALTKLAVAGNRAYTWTGSLNNQSICFAYPKAFGTLTSIKDANNFDYLSGYSRSEVTVNGETYYVYMSSKSIINDFKQIFG